MTKPPLRRGGANDFQTPKEAINPLLPYLNKDWIIWECASGNGNLVKSFTEKGFSVIESDILTGKNFLTYEPLRFDCIITNPPFSIKQKFLERAYELDKPFAFLLPLTTLETAKRQELFKKYGLQIILFDKRINFETPDGMNNNSSWFATAWFTNKLNLPKELNYTTWKS